MSAASSCPESGQPSSTRRRRTAIVVVLGLALLASACGDKVGIAESQGTPPSGPTTGGRGVEAPAGALLGATPAGDTIVGPDGRSLYAFTNDTQAVSTCYGTCADAWPPVIVSADWIVGPGLDSGVFATTVRDDGRLQLMVGRWPLYYYAGDAAPGDINGQGSGEVWYLVAPAGTLITDLDRPLPSDQLGAADSDAGGPGGAIVEAGDTELGPSLVDGTGRTLYGLTDDTGGEPTCYEACADAWPPLLVDSAELPPGLDPTVFGTVERIDGSYQLTAGSWPLYTFAGDAAPGDVNGQGSGDVWWVVDAAGGLIRSDGTVDEIPGGGY